jgi:hypothetical protein
MMSIHRETAADSYKGTLTSKEQGVIEVLHYTKGAVVWLMSDFGRAD